MAQPSRSLERRRQIIAATVQCMAADGVGGTTLARIAETAGMARGHMRHFAGNREALLTDAARVFYFGETALEQPDLDVAELERRAPLVPSAADTTGALDYLFGEFAEPGSENAAANAFMDAGRTIPDIHRIVVTAYRGMEQSLTRLLEREHPKSPAADCRRVAYGVLTIAMGHNLLNEVDAAAERSDAARAGALRLIAELDAD
ncbi:TetR/AcrR family transcriptional regulator [Schumannella soli]|uniref:TetR family transcriptional regulator n=1 Tax=Schumannella soli TaxID=2590779 RepID=A0A506XZ99_9MICO|nr:TetR/AcrR family transcriptional regulator [Schumannella soli]TPW74048.1 TetR family transcriptional regulator [Schumannella soli]